MTGAFARAAVEFVERWLCNPQDWNRLEIKATEFEVLVRLFLCRSRWGHGSHERVAPGPAQLRPGLPRVPRLPPTLALAEPHTPDSARKPHLVARSASHTKPHAKPIKASHARYTKSYALRLVNKGGVSLRAREGRGSARLPSGRVKRAGRRGRTWDPGQVQRAMQTRAS